MQGEDMQTSQQQGSAGRWGPLFDARAEDWAQTWEGPHGWGQPVYAYVLESTEVGSGTRLLDCGCGAGRFARMAADRGAQVAGLDAAAGLIEIARRRVPGGEFRVGDLESLPWPDAEFDLAVGLSAFQFADDKVRALAEARRVSRGPVAVAVPARLADSGIAAVFAPLAGLFPVQALDRMRASGMFALSQPGRLDQVLTEAGLHVRQDDDIDSPAAFPDAATAVRAFAAAGPMAVAVQHSGEVAVAAAVNAALAPFTDADGRITLPASYRLVIADAGPDTGTLCPPSPAR
jgi:SAM-dependent methyltransferase